MSNQFVGVKEASEILGVHQLTVRNWIRAGELPSRRIGRRVLIPRRAVEDRAEPAPREQRESPELRLREAPMMELLAETMRTGAPVLGRASDKGGQLMWFDGPSGGALSADRRLEDHIGDLEALLECPELAAGHEASLRRLLDALRKVVEELESSDEDGGSSEG